MAKNKLTAGRLQSFQCAAGTAQSFLWCEEVHGLGVRATANSSRKRYIFQSKIKGQSVRMTIGEVGVWSISKAQAEARRLQVLIDQGHDPRRVEEDRNAAEEAKAVALRSEKKSQSLTVAEAWEAYTTERSSSLNNHRLKPVGW